MVHRGLSVLPGNLLDADSPHRNQTEKEADYQPKIFHQFRYTQIRSQMLAEATKKGRSGVGLYLFISEDGEDLDGVEVGGYEDFNILRNSVTQNLEDGKIGSKFPTLNLHSDCDGEWSVEECAELEKELVQIIEAFQRLPASPFHSPWQVEVAKRRGQQPRNLYESFIDINGQFILNELLELARSAQKKQKPITFQ